MKLRSVLFVNTYPPVVPLYEDTFPKLQRQGIVPEALVSISGYRETGRKHEAVRKRQLWVPAWLRLNRRWSAVFYWIIAPFVLLDRQYRGFVFLTQPPLLYAIGAWIARRRSIPYCVHVMDLYPDLLRCGSAPAGRLFARLFAPLAASALREARQVIVIGRCMRDRIVEKGVAKEKITVIPNWPDRAIGNAPASGDSFRRSHGLVDKFVVMYSGNMGRFHNFDAILAVANSLMVEPSVTFVFIGSGVRKPEIKSASNRCSNIVTLGHQADAEFPRVLAAGDVHFVCLKSGFEGLMVPSKFYGILAAGRPVIYEGEPSGEVARVILEEKCGRVVIPDNVAGLERAVRDYIDDRDSVYAHGRNARRAYEKRFERNVLACRYSDLLVSSGIAGER